MGTTHDDKLLETLPCAHVMPVVMLATIRLPVYDVDGQPQGARVLLDSGSSVSFISEKLVKKLKLVRRTCNVGLDTVGSGPVQSVRACVEVRLGYTEFEVPLAVNCLILNRIVGILPANKVEVPGELVNFSGKLADPDWNNPSVVDMLLGRICTILLQREKIYISER